MFGHSSLDVSLLSYLQNHVDVRISGVMKGDWFLIGFYGIPQWHKM